VDDTILAPYVYRETAALKDLSIGRFERTSAAPSLFGPERRKMRVRVSSERMRAAAFRVLNSASVIRFRSLHLLIRQPWKDGEHCNRAVEVDCPPGFTAASIQNGVTA
jgi:hypothetical protein